jgi:hypothetical protein
MRTRRCSSFEMSAPALANSMPPVFIIAIDIMLKIWTLLFVLTALNFEREVPIPVNDSQEVPTGSSTPASMPSEYFVDPGSYARIVTI